MRNAIPARYNTQPCMGVRFLAPGEPVSQENRGYSVRGGVPVYTLLSNARQALFKMRSAQTRQRPGDSRLQAAAVICWDWTKAIALPREPVARRHFSPRVLSGVMGHDALGLSHLTYRTTGTINFHQLDQPPFPCKHTVTRYAWRRQEAVVAQFDEDLFLRG
jgi:hypothetical protein